MCEAARRNVARAKRLLLCSEVEIHGEARSHSGAKLDAQIATMRKALQEATAEHPVARLNVEVHRSYEAYRLTCDEPIIQRVTEALQAIGEAPPQFHLTGGGSDANVLNARGITAVPVSTGMQSVHTTEERIAASDMVRSAELVLHVLDR